MSIATLAISEAVVAGQATPSATSNSKAPPRNRTIVANSDAIALPEAR